MCSFQTINVRDLELLALERYKECPKFVTIVRHADREDDSLFHCVPSKGFVGPLIPGGKTYKRNFIVPGQNVVMVTDNNFGLFTILKVLETDDGPTYWLISSEQSRMGFIIGYKQLPENLREIAEAVH